MEVKKITFIITLLITFTALPSANASSLKCLSKPALQASLTASKTALSALEKSLPKQLELANSIKAKLPTALKAMEQSYATYKRNPTPENKKDFDRKNFTYQSLNASYNLQYDLYLGQKKRIPGLINDISRSSTKLLALTKECAKACYLTRIKIYFIKFHILL